MIQEPVRQKFVGDRELSTYRWELYLAGPKAYVFDGYSKNRGQNEKHDKQALFQDCVARICFSGYLDKTYQMLWYKRGGALQHKKEDRLLLAMYPTYFIAHNELQLDLSTVNYLKRLYDAKHSGQPFNPKHLLPPRESVRDFEALDFSFSLARFPTEDILVEHCKELVNRYEYSRVEAWWKKVKEAYLDAPVLIKEPLVYNPAPATSQQPINHQRPANHREAGRQTPNMTPPGAPVNQDNQQAVANAKGAISGMLNKFDVNRK